MISRTRVGSARGVRRPGHQRPGPAAPIREMAARLGNRATGSLIQAKLRVSVPGDRFEREADRLADQITRMPEPGVQQCTGCAGRPPCAGCAETEEVPVIQRIEDGPGGGGSVPEALVSGLSAGRPLDPQSRAYFEPRFGREFGDVRVHDNAAAHASARALGARAYTLGPDIAFAPGEYRPDTAAGRGVIAHELVHVVQQHGPGNAARTIQRLPGSAAGGCGVCYAPGFTEIGNIAHGMIEAAMIAQWAFLVPRHEILNVIPGLGVKGIPDLMEMTGPDSVAIGEIKPNSPSGIELGISELNIYERQLKALGMKVTRMNWPPPLAALPFPTGAIPSPTCPATHSLYVDAPVNGLYTYWCSPDFKVLRPRCECSKRPPPPPPPVPVPKEADERKRHRVDDEDDVKQPGTPPLVPVLVTAAIALGILGRKQIAKQLGKFAVGRALAYAEAAAVLALVLLYPERVEAGFSDELALEKLFRAMSEKGVKVPPDLEKRLTSDPELKALLEKAAKSGNYKEAQAELQKKMMKLINDHPEDFTDEDLRFLLTATEASSATSEKDPTVESLKKAIERARKGKASAGAEEGTEDPKEGPGTAGKKEGGGAGPGPTAEGEGPKTKYPGLSAEVQKELDAAPAAVRVALQQILGRTEGGPKLDDAAVRRFLATIPKDLTEDEARRLAELRSPSGGKGLDDILLNLARAVEAVRAGTAKPGEGKPGKPGAGDEAGAPSADDVAKKNPKLSAEAREKLAKASPRARRFLDAVASKGLAGVPLTDEGVDRLLAIFDTAVTEEQVDALVARLGDVKPEHTLDNVLESLEKALKAKDKKPGTGGTEAGKGGGSKKGAGADGRGKKGAGSGSKGKVKGPPDSELLPELLELLQGKVTDGEARLEWDGKRPKTGSVKTGCRFFGKTTDGTAYIARVSVKFTKVKEPSATYKIIAAGKVYTVTGGTFTPDRPLVGLVRTIEMDPPETEKE